MRPRILVDPISEAPDAWDAFRRVHREGEGAIFLDACPASDLTPAERALRRWSFVAAAPAATLTAGGGGAFLRAGAGSWSRVDADPLDALRELSEAAVDVPEGAPPFVGGAAGLVSYDAARLVERLPVTAADDQGLPWVHAFRFDAALAFDHHAGRAFLARLDTPGGEACANVLRVRLAEPAPPLSPVAEGARLASNHGREGFMRQVEAGKRHVRAGDVFQVNLSHRLTGPAPGAPLAVYARLREANAAPFAGFLASGPLPEEAAPFHVLSSSPERLFRLTGRELEARPIAGTRPRGATPEADKALASELLASDKERAEHVMLVDLARNDLGRVAEYGSVQVDRLLTVESYRRVHHLVSVVTAQLRGGLDAVDALRALFPGGTITGAPKVRSMEIIEALEGVRRGAYTGSLGFVSHGGHAADFNILIRTLVLEADRLHLQVGAGIVEDSEPAREWEETLAKARALLEAVGLTPEAVP